MILLRNSFQRNTGDLGGSDLPVEMRNLFLQTATKSPQREPSRMCEEFLNS